MSDTASIDLVAELEEVLRSQGERSRMAQARDAIRRRYGTETPDPIKAAAGNLLSVRITEIASVEPSPIGTLITTTDDVEYVAVPQDHPDGEGKAGLMLRRPTRSPWTNQGFPHYVAPSEVEAEDASPDVESPPRRRGVGIDVEKIRADMDARAADRVTTELQEPIETLITRAALDRRARAVEDEHQRLTEARALTASLDDLRSIDRRLADLADQALVLRNRRPDVVRAEVAAGEQRDRERRAEIERREAELLAAAGPIFERIRAAHAELDVLREEAIATGLGEHWRDRAKLPRGAFGQFSGTFHAGLDPLDGFVEWLRTGDNPIKLVVAARPETGAAGAGTLAPNSTPRTQRDY